MKNARSLGLLVIQFSTGELRILTLLSAGGVLGLGQATGQPPLPHQGDPRWTLVWAAWQLAKGNK